MRAMPPSQASLYGFGFRSQQPSQTKLNKIGDLLMAKYFALLSEVLLGGGVPYRSRALCFFTLLVPAVPERQKRSGYLLPQQWRTDLLSRGL
jgi:hypothetical protein